MFEFTRPAAGSAAPCHRPLAGRPRRVRPRWLLLGALALTPLAAQPALAGELTPTIAGELAGAGPAELVSAIVTLEGAPEAAAMAGAPRERVVGRMKAASARAVRDLDLPEGVRLTGRYWVAGAISVTGVPAGIRALAETEGVESVDEDPVVRIAAPKAEGGAAAVGNWGLDAMRVPEAWSSLGRDGSGVTIGSIDSGVEAGHPDLAGRVAGFRDFVGGRSSAYDDNGHGTHTIGTMVGGRASGAPIGVAPEAKVMVAKALDREGWGSGSALLAAGQWMADPDGNPATDDQPEVINNSWGSTGATNTWYRQMVRTWRELDIVPVFSAGNSGPGASTIMNPASYPESVAVAAVDRSSAPASFSARGPVIWEDRDRTGPSSGTRLSKPDVAAPGVGITSSVGGGWQSYSGTSMAAPQVAGVVALMREASPAMSAPEIADALRDTARDAGTSGHDDATGAGTVDALAAVSRAEGRTAPPPSVAPEPAPAPAPEPEPEAPVAENPAEPKPEAPTRTPRDRTGGAVTLSVEQLRINQRISQTAVRRVNTALARLGEGSGARSGSSGGKVTLSRGQLLINQRISQAAVRRAARAEALLKGLEPDGERRAASGASTVSLTAAQLLINQRISQAAMRRANDLLARTAGI